MIALIVPLICLILAGLCLVVGVKSSPQQRQQPPTRVYVHTVTRDRKPSRPRRYGYRKPRTYRRPQPYREDLDDYM